MHSSSNTRPRKLPLKPLARTDQNPQVRRSCLFAEKIAQEKGVVIPDEAKASSAAISAWIESKQSAKPGKGRRKTGSKRPVLAEARTTMPTKRTRKPKAGYLSRLLLSRIPQATRRFEFLTVTRRPRKSSALDTAQEGGTRRLALILPPSARRGGCKVRR